MGKSSWVGAMPNTAAQVAELQTSFSNLHRDDTFSMDFFNDTKMRLESLKNMIKTSEDLFYSKLHLPPGMLGVKELQKRLDEANNDSGFRSMTNFKDSDFDRIVISAMEGIDYSKPAIMFIKDEKTRNELVQALKGEVGANVGQILINTLNKMQDEKIAIKADPHSIRSLDQKGLLPYIRSVKVLRRKSKEDPWQVEINAPDIPIPWRKRLTEYYGVQFAQSKDNLINYLKNWLSGIIQNPVLWNYVSYQFDQNRGKFDVNNSAASIKGFLGEVRSAAFLDFLMNQHGAADPTGNLKSATYKTEIPIDLVLEGFGFQIKNYRLTKSGAVNFRRSDNDSMGMGNFIELRLNPEASIAEIMTDFFGSYQYNQPVQGAKNYSNIYNRFTNIVDGRAKDIFDGYLDNILKISETFSVDNSEVFGEQQLYFNTFFIIGDRIVPSSLILQAIINQLNIEAKQDSLIKSSYNISTPIADENVWPTDTNNTSLSSKEYANKIKISWNIKLNLIEILERAQSGIL